MKTFHRFMGSLVLMSASIALAATPSTKDIVLDHVTAPAVGHPAPSGNRDALVASVLLESPDGTLTPKSTETLFHTGDRFRVKLLASRNGHISLYNTNQRGVTNPEPLWRGDISVGTELITPRLALTGSSGVDLLHVVFEPASISDGIFGWLSTWLKNSRDALATGKNIDLDIESTRQATYIVRNRGDGIVSTVSIIHAH